MDGLGNICGHTRHISPVLINKDSELLHMLSENPNVVPQIRYNYCLHFDYVTVWCGFTVEFIFAPFSLWKSLLNWPKNCSVASACFIELLKKHMIPGSRKRECLEMECLWNITWHKWRYCFVFTHGCRNTPFKWKLLLSHMSWPKDCNYLSSILENSENCMIPILFRLEVLKQPG